jgi:hypothetical protein
MAGESYAKGHTTWCRLFDSGLNKKKILHICDSIISVSFCNMTKWNITSTVCDVTWMQCAQKKSEREKQDIKCVHMHFICIQLLKHFVIVGMWSSTGYWFMLWGSACCNWDGHWQMLWSVSLKKWTVDVQWTNIINNYDVATILSVCYDMNVDEGKLHYCVDKKRAWRRVEKRESDFSAVSISENVCA